MVGLQKNKGYKKIIKKIFFLKYSIKSSNGQLRLDEIPLDVNMLGHVEKGGICLFALAPLQPTLTHVVDTVNV